MRYKIDFELPDNETIQKEIKKTLVQWNFHGYSGTCFAEPEPEEFEWCHDCKEYDTEKHCCHRWTKVIRQTVEKMKTDWRWIPVTEALPKPWQEVLTTYEYNGKRFVQTAEYAGQKDEKGHPLFCAYSDEFAPNHYDFIYVAWMPLPEPAKIGDGK